MSIHLRNIDSLVGVFSRSVISDIAFELHRDVNLLADIHAFLSAHLHAIDSNPTVSATWAEVLISLSSEFEGEKRDLHVRAFESLWRHCPFQLEVLEHFVSPSINNVVVNKLLEMRAVPAPTSERNVRLAVQSNHVELVRAMARAVPSRVAARGEDGHTTVRDVWRNSLSWASSEEMIRLLRQECGISWSAKTMDHAVQRGNCAVIQCLLDLTPTSPCPVSERHVALAAKAGRADIIRVLLSSPIPIHIGDPTMLAACTGGHIHLAQELIRGSLGTPCVPGWSTVRFLAQQRRSDVLADVFDRIGADAARKTVDPWAVVWTIVNDDKETYRVLVRANAHACISDCVVNAMAKYGAWACAPGPDKFVLNDLIDRIRLSGRARTLVSPQVLATAVQVGDGRQVEALVRIRHSIDGEGLPRIEPPEDGQLALSEAAKAGNIGMINQLIEMGTVPTADTLKMLAASPVSLEDIEALMEGSLAPAANLWNTPDVWASACACRRHDIVRMIARKVEALELEDCAADHCALAAAISSGCLETMSSLLPHVSTGVETFRLILMEAPLQIRAEFMDGERQFSVEELRMIHAFVDAHPEVFSPASAFLLSRAMGRARAQAE